jgi:hypothetical protein
MITLRKTDKRGRLCLVASPDGCDADVPMFDLARLA